MCEKTPHKEGENNENNDNNDDDKKQQIPVKSESAPAQDINQKDVNIDVQNNSNPFEGQDYRGNAYD